MPRLKLNPLLACAALAVAGAAVPALAQVNTAGEITVYGSYGVGPEVRRLSAAVPYGDLDLTTVAGREILKQRVHDTARDLCARLGENGMNDGLVPSCEQDAINSAQEGERFAIATAQPPVYAVAQPYDQPYVAPAGPTARQTAPAATSYGRQAATITTETVTNGPVPDTVANRSRYGGPMSNGGRATAPAGN
jgi:UrcA family protein